MNLLSFELIIMQMVDNHEQYIKLICAHLPVSCHVPYQQYYYITPLCLWKAGWKRRQDVPCIFKSWVIFDNYAELHYTKKLHPEIPLFQHLVHSVQFTCSLPLAGRGCHAPFRCDVLSSCTSFHSWGSGSHLPFSHRVPNSCVPFLHRPVGSLLPFHSYGPTSHIPFKFN